MALLSWLSLALFGDRHVWRYSGWCRVKAFITRHAVTHALTDGHKLMKIRQTFVDPIGAVSCQLFASPF